MGSTADFGAGFGAARRRRPGLRYWPVQYLGGSTAARQQASHMSTALFAVMDARTGKVVVDLHRRHRSVEFRKFLDLIEASVTAGLYVSLTLDNYDTHKTSELSRALHNHWSFVD